MTEIFTLFSTIPVTEQGSWDLDPRVCLLTTALSGVFTDQSNYIAKCLPSANIVLGAEARIVSKTDKAPASRGPYSSVS